MLDTTGFIPQPVRRSSLGHRQPIASGDETARLAERKFLGKLILRGDAAQIAPIIESATGLMLPTMSGGSASTGYLTALWLGPSEWMLLTPENEEKTVAANIQAGLQGLHYQLTDVTDYYTIIRLSGWPSREMLMKLTTLDMHPDKFPEGTAKGSIFGRVAAVLHHPVGESTPTFDLVIRASHADYLWCLLALAGREYGLPEQVPTGRVKLGYPH